MNLSRQSLKRLNLDARAFGLIAVIGHNQIVFLTSFEERRLNMSDYLKFVMFNLKHTVDITAGRKLKRGMFVGESFRFH